MNSQPGGELDQLRAIVREFVDERDWDQFHTPKNLASALTVEAAELLALKAAWLYDHGQPCGSEANAAKLLAADAGFAACEAAVQVHGGFGYAREYHVERLWRECRLLKIAPVSQEMVLNSISEHVLGLPRSY